NVSFEALVNAIFAATGVFKKETLLEFEPDIAKRVVSIDLDGYRSCCIIFPALERVGRCQLNWTYEPSRYSFKHRGAQPDGAANGSQPIRSEANRTPVA